MATAAEVLAAMGEKQVQTRATKMERRAKSMRTTLWPDVSDDELWDRKKAAGFTTMPRTMPQLINVIDSLTKGQPAGMTYLTIWCRLFYSGIVELASERQMATESGFSGERAVDTWRKRMRHLKDLGFIDYQTGGDHDFQWVLVFNPHHVMRKLGKKVQSRLLAAWLSPAVEVGAKDLDSAAPAPAAASPAKKAVAKTSPAATPRPRRRAS